MNLLILKGGAPGTPGLAPRLITDKHGRQVTHWVRVTPQVEQRARGYTQAQQELDFDRDPYAHLETRPATRPAQRQQGHDALAALRRRIGRLRDSGGSTATLLGARLVGDYHAAGHARLVGEQIREPEDVATLAQVYRDPRFETFRCLYVDAQQRIVGEAAYSNRLPGLVIFPPDLHTQIAGDKARFGATGYYLLHNHPSGLATPSPADLQGTQHIHQAVPGLRAHVVVDHDEYAVITMTPDGLRAEAEVIAAPQFAGQDFHAVPGAPHDVLGIQLRRPADVQVVATMLHANGELTCPVLVMTKGVDARVDLVCQTPMPALLMQQERHGRLPALIRSLGRMTGAGSLRFLAVSDADLTTHWNAFADMIRQGWLTDVVSDAGVSLREQDNSVVGARHLFDSNHPGRKVA